MKSCFIVGVISDTHGLMRSQVTEVFVGVDLILHGGDIGNVQVIESLEKSVVVAIRSFSQSLHDRLGAIPGVSASSISTDLPLKGDGELRVFTPDRMGDAGGLPPSVAVT